MYKRNLTFDVNNRIDVFTLVLAHRSHKKYGVIQNCKNIRFKDSLQPDHELSFQVYKELVSDEKKVLCSVWDEIRDFRYVYVPELEEYFEITVNIEDSGQAVKSITAIHAAVPELTNVRLRSLEINTENDILRDDYEIPTVFYNPDHQEASLLHRIFAQAKHYSIRHVDSSLAGIQKTFAVSDTNLYDFCITTLSEEIGCLFVLNSGDRSVSVYDLFNQCSDCGHRGEFDRVCPQCGSQKVITPLGESTGIFISRENLAESIALTPQTEQIKNCLYVRGGDDLITATAANCSPSGSRIYQFSQDMLADMSPELAGALEAYQKQYDSMAPDYRLVMSQIYERIDEELYLESGMMPDLAHSPISAKTQLALLTPENLSPIAVEDTSKVSLATANSAVSGMAAVTVGKDCKVEIVSSSLSSQTWTGSFRVTSRHDKEDTAEGPVIRLTITDDYQQYVQQKIDRMFHKETAEGLTDLLTIEDLTLFTEELKKYCQNRLHSFQEAFQSCLDILVERGCADPNTYPDLHENLYQPYYRKHQAISLELAARTRQIDAVQKARAALEQQKAAMQQQLNLDNFLDQELYTEFLAHLIVDEYVNDNYISDGLDNARLFETAQELLTAAQTELTRNLNKSYAISASLEDLLKIHEFRPLVSRFQCGNWFVCQVDDALYRMRLLSYEITFDESSGQILTVEFSNATKHTGPGETAKSILSGAKSMAQSFSYVARQADKGAQADNTFQEFQKNGLDSSLFRIKNADTEEVLIDRHGITCRSYDDILEDYQPEQAAFIHNSLVFTTDNWKTAKCALGKLTYSFDGKEYTDYGLNTDAVISGLIVGGDIYSANFSSANHTGTHICLTDGTFSFAGDKLTYDGTGLAVNGRILSSTGRIGCWEINGSSIYKSDPGFGKKGGMYFGADGLSLGSAFKVDSNGSLTSTNANITGTISSSNLTATGGTIGGSSLNSSGIFFNNGGTGWGLWGTTAHANIAFHAGANSAGIGSAPFRVYHNGSVVSNNFQTKGGEIGGWNIGNYGIYNDKLKTGLVNIGAFRIYSGRFTYQQMLESSYDSDEFPYFGVTEQGSVFATSIDCRGGIYAASNMAVAGNLTVSGTKNRMVSTENYSQKLLYSYETSSPFFGDIGNATLDEHGECYVGLDVVFSETVNTQDCHYHVFLTKYGQGDAYIAERSPDYFLIKGTPGLTLSWEIKAKQKDYEYSRLEDYDTLNSHDPANIEIDYEVETENWINQLEKEMYNYA